MTKLTLNFDSVNYSIKLKLNNARSKDHANSPSSMQTSGGVPLSAAERANEEEKEDCEASETHSVREEADYTGTKTTGGETMERKTTDQKNLAVDKHTITYLLTHMSELSGQ